MSIKVRVVGSLALLLGAKLITIQVWYIDLAPVTLFPCPHDTGGINGVEPPDFENHPSVLIHRRASLAMREKGALYFQGFGGHSWRDISGGGSRRSRGSTAGSVRGGAFCNGARVRYRAKLCVGCSRGKREVMIGALPFCDEGV